MKSTITPFDLTKKWFESMISDFKEISPNQGKSKSDYLITLDPSKIFHSMLGMGYSFEHTSCYNLLQMKPKDRNDTIKLLVDPTHGAGMNLWRLCIGTPDFTGTPWYSYDDCPPKPEEDPIEHLESHFSIQPDLDLIIPIIKEALSINPNILLFASPWSPPGWMKDSGVMCGGLLLPQYYPVYALYLAKFIEAYQALGIFIHAITVQNEPYHNSISMPTCRWTANEERDFIKGWLGPMFKAKGLKTEIWCYDHNWDDLPFRPSHYPQVILKDPDAAQYVSGVGFHHYSVFGWSNPKLMLKMRARFPSPPFYFTEGSLFSMWGALRMARYLRYGCSSYNGWVPILDTEGKPNNGPFKPKTSLIQLKVPEKKLQINQDFWWQGHFMRSIHRGAKVIGIDNPSRHGFESIAFLNLDGTKSLICVNKNKREKKIRVIFEKKECIFTLPPESLITLEW